MRWLAIGDSLTAGYGKLGTEFFPYSGEEAKVFWYYYHTKRREELFSEILSKHLKCKVDHIGLSGWTVGQMVFNSNLERCTDVCGIVWPGLEVHLRRARDEGDPVTHVAIMGGTNDLGDTQTSHILEVVLADFYLNRRCLP